MDTEEQIKIEQAIRDGRPETDEGPYYHDSWWESYKASIKGKLGGAVIGALVGAAIGVAAVAVLSFVSTAIIPAGAIGATIAAFAGAGLMYGQHEFSDIGTVTGAVAAAHERAESRMKSFETGKFAEVERKLDKIESMLSGQPVESKTVPTTDGAYATSHSQSYRTTHCDEHCEPKDTRWFYPKVALIGLVVGVAMGAALAASGLATPLLTELGLQVLKKGATTAGVELAKGAATVASEMVIAKGALYAAAMATFGLIGASFGINRDIFRKVFDKTDLWFKGILQRNGNVPSIVHAKGEEPVQAPAKADAVTIVYDSHIDYPVSETHHRDKVVAQAMQTLLSHDHTKAVRQ